MNNSEKIEKIIKIFKIDNPNPKTELNYRNDLTLLIAILLSAQATDNSVNKATELLFQEFNTIESFAKLSIENLQDYFKSINLYKTKSKHIFYLIKMIESEFKNKVPIKFEELIKLPGVGRKTANVFLSISQNKNTMGVDTHILRVSNRIGLIKTTQVLQAEKTLMKIIPENEIINIHQWLVLHGRYICKARKPNCKECKINTLCNYNLQDHILCKTTN